MAKQPRSDDAKRKAVILWRRKSDRQKTISLPTKERLENAAKAREHELLGDK